MVAAALASLAVTMPASLDLPQEFRGVWIATVDNIDWPSKRGLPTRQAKAELLRILDRAQELKLNAVVFQIRPSADALFKSKLEPWSEYLTGEQGKAPDEDWDPLAFAVTEAHRRGLELHTWFNPYRARHPVAKTPEAPNHIARKNPRVVKSYGRYLWMDPSEKAVQDQTFNVMMDVVRRYDVDAIHIDDYFYPYKERGADGKLLDFPDDDSWNRYKASGGKLSRDDWRRKSVDDIIYRIYRGVKAEKPWVKFGISPFGIYRPGVPQGIQAGVDQYADLYADARKWFVEGWCDYYSPQLYWPIAQTPQSFPVLLKWWNDKAQNPKGRHLWPGLFTGRVLPNQGDWPAKEVVDQIGLIRGAVKGPGHVHFSMRALMQNPKSLNEALGNLYNRPALVPPSPWLGNEKLKAPELKREGRSVLWDKDPKARFYAVKAGSGEWRISSSTHVRTEPGVAVTVVPISRTGVLGTAATVR